MVGFHTPERPRALIIKRGRRSSLLTRTPTCLWPGCYAALAHDHAAPICGCHVKPTYNLSHDRSAENLVLHLLLAAYPDAVDLCGVLHCSSRKVERPIRCLRNVGHEIVGTHRGYVYVPPRFKSCDRGRPRARTVKA